MAPLEFRLLGPLEACLDGRPLALVGPKRRALLALLLLTPNRVVSIPRIIDALWGDDPPASARAQVQSLVHAVRQQLAATEDAGVTIETRPSGYVLEVEEDRIDLSVFEHRVLEARAAAADQRPEAAADGFRAALELWRGPALDGVEAPFVTAEAARLEEQRILALEERVETDLALGRHATVAAELVGRVAEHPFRERLRGALMLALYRCGRQAEALNVYQEGREALVESLGVTPGRELQALERAILRAEPSLDLSPPPHAGPPPEPAPGEAPDASGEPAEVPAEAAGAPGRAAEETSPPVPGHPVRRVLALAAIGVIAALAGLALAARDQLHELPGVSLVARSQRPPPVAQTGRCTPKVQAVTDYRGRAFDHVYHCSTYVGENLYANPQDQAPLQDVSYMNAAADTWVVCQLRGRPNPVLRGRTSSWWLYTQGDTDNRPNDYGYTHAWGFLPATAVSQSAGSEPVPGVGVCVIDYAVPGPPSVSSPEYPADGSRHGAAGVAGSFVLAPTIGTTDLSGFVYSLDTDSPDTFLPATGRTVLHLVPPSAGPHTLFVRTRDREGNLSPMRTYAFEVGP